jgi:hypothetical protein
MKTHSTDPTLAGDDSPSSWFAAWDRFWFQPLNPTTLGFMRICCGLIVLYVHLSYSWNLLSFVGPDAWISEKYTERTRKEEPMYAPPWDWQDQLRRPDQVAEGREVWSIYHHVTDPAWIYVIHAGILVVMLLFTIGLWTRETAALTWMGAMSYIQRAHTSLFGMDTMMIITLLYLMIAPSGATLSVDRLLECWRARRRGAAPPPVQPSIVANFATRLFQIHFCFIYMASGTSKLLGAAWWNGTAPGNVLLNPEFAPMAWGVYRSLMKFLAGNRLLWELMMTGGVMFTLVVEIGLPFLIWYKKLRWLMVTCSVLLHVAIGLTMGLTTFSLMMMVMVMSFVPPEVVGRLVDSLSRRGRELLRAGTSKATARKKEELALSR